MPPAIWPVCCATAGDCFARYYVRMAELRESLRIVAQAVRVPVASVSCVDFHLMTERPATVEQVNAAFRAAGGVIGATDRPLVSTDLRARPESVVMACPETKVTPQGMLRVFGWYDNEWGFSNRMLDMACRMGWA